MKKMEISKFAYMLIIFTGLGFLGIHRMLNGQVKTGVLQLILTVTLVFSFVTVIWAIIDLIRCAISIENSDDFFNKPIVNVSN